MTEEYDVSAPGSLFALVVQEPDIWKVASAKTKLAIAEDWDAVGAPMPTAADMKGLDAAQRRGLQLLAQSLQRHSLANKQIETAAMQRELDALKPQGHSGGKLRKSADFRRDSEGRLLRAEFHHHE